MYDPLSTLLTGQPPLSEPQKEKDPVRHPVCRLPSGLLGVWGADGDKTLVYRHKRSAQKISSKGTDKRSFPEYIKTLRLSAVEDGYQRLSTYPLNDTDVQTS